jgi:hypothetical protein
MGAQQSTPADNMPDPDTVAGSTSSIGAPTVDAPPDAPSNRVRDTNLNSAMQKFADDLCDGFRKELFSK